ncbi:MAG: hypothetical protein SGI90_13980 [Candidatus Eisenbacteria bacterium]|nr:hypothetical protein [Candidatus Eisenbacteria bacterium]
MNRRSGRISSQATTGIKSPGADGLEFDIAPRTKMADPDKL